jgi:hypothetical protein
MTRGFDEMPAKHEHFRRFVTTAGRGGTADATDLKSVELPDHKQLTSKRLRDEPESAESAIRALLAKSNGRFRLTKVGCWRWQGPVCDDGYARLATKNRELVHRLTFAWYFGDPPLEGLELDHLCRDRRCINPLHLDAVPHSVNVRRSLTTWALNEDKAAVIRWMNRNGFSAGEIASRFVMRTRLIRKLLADQLPKRPDGGIADVFIEQPYEWTRHSSGRRLCPPQRPPAAPAGGAA